jgi:hypothetical protein
MKLSFGIEVVFTIYEGKSKTLVDSRICKGVVLKYCINSFLVQAQN